MFQPLSSGNAHVVQYEKCYRLSPGQVEVEGVGPGGLRCHRATEESRSLQKEEEEEAERHRENCSLPPLRTGRKRDVIMMSHSLIRVTLRYLEIEWFTQTNHTDTG